MQRRFIFGILLMLLSNSIFAQINIKGAEYWKDLSWKSLQNSTIYRDNSFKTKIGTLKKGEKFKFLDSYFIFYDYINAKITKIGRNDFAECKNDGIQLGDNIKLLIGYGESEWSILHKGKLKYATFSFDYDNNKLTDAVYEGCNKINGIITKSTETRHFIVKIKTNNGTVGYIRFITNGNHRYEFLEFIQSY